MKFNYDLYRPKKVIKDAWKANSTYFRAKDVQVTPLTKIGDADEVYKSQSSGRIPALARKFKPKKQLVLSEILPRRKKIFVRSADDSSKLEVRVKTPLRGLKKQLDVSPAVSNAPAQFTSRIADLGREAVATIQRTWRTQRTSLSHLALVVLVVGAGAGSVHAYMNHANAARSDSASQSSNHATAQQETTDTQQGTQATTPTPTTPEPVAATPDEQAVPQDSISAANDMPESQPNYTTPTNVANTAPNTTVAPQPAVQPTSNPTPAPAPSAPANTPAPTTSPTTQPQPTPAPTTDTTSQSPNDAPQTASPSPSTNTNQTAPTPSTDTTDTSTQTKDRRSSTQQFK